MTYESNERGTANLNPRVIPRLCHLAMVSVCKVLIRGVLCRFTTVLAFQLRYSLAFHLRYSLAFQLRYSLSSSYGDSERARFARLSTTPLSSWPLLSSCRRRFILLEPRLGSCCPFLAAGLRIGVNLKRYGKKVSYT